MRIAKLLSVALIVVFAVGLIGCKKPAETGGSGETATVATVNAKCPMMGGKFNSAKVAPDLVRELAGQKVGFCCAGCLPKWDKLTDVEKTAKLAAAMAPPIPPP